MLRNKRKFKFIAVLTVIAISAFMLTGCGKNESIKEENNKNSDNNTYSNSVKNTYEEPIKNKVEGIAEANSSKFLSSYPSFIAEHIGQVITEDYLKSQLEEYKDKYGDNIKISYNVTNQEEISGNKLKDVQQKMKNTYDVDVNITKGYELSVEIKVKGDNSKKTDNNKYEVYEINGKWYLLSL